jgi:chaperonin GroES
MIEPIGDRILVKPIIEEERTSGGIYIPDSARQVPDKGVIVSVGEEVVSKKLAPGKAVLFRQHSGTTVTFDNVEYIILPVKEVIGIMEVKG